MACFRFATGVANSWSIDSRTMSVTDQFTKWGSSCCFDVHGEHQ